MHNYEAIAENLEKCAIPAELDGKTYCLKKVLAFSKKTRAIIAALVASARRDNFSGDVAGWVEWAKENELAGADLHHLRQIGDLLLDAKKTDDSLCRRLFSIDTEKLLAMSRLKRKDLVKFVAAYPPEKLNRDEVREAVCRCLGEEPKTGKAKSDKYQPDMWESVDALISHDEHSFLELAGSERFDDRSAAKFAIASVGMLTASIERWSHSDGVKASALATLEAQLRDKADRLRDIRESRTAKMIAAG